MGHITFNERGCDSKACEGCGDESELHVCCLGVVNRRCCSSDEEVSIVNGKAIILYYCVFWWAIPCYSQASYALIRSPVWSVCCIVHSSSLIRSSMSENSADTWSRSGIACEMSACLFHCSAVDLSHCWWSMLEVGSLNPRLSCTEQAILL